MTLTATWISPNGVEHKQPYGSDCLTCGGRHNTLHADMVACYPAAHAEPCTIKRLPAPPYEIKLTQDHPGWQVYECIPHQTWWAEPGVGSKR